MTVHRSLGGFYGAITVNPRPVQTIRDAPSAAGATAYTTTLSAASVMHGSPVTVTVTPNGLWGEGLTATASAPGLTGSFDAVKKTPAADKVTPVTFSFTASAVGSGVIAITIAKMASASGSRALTVT